MSPFWAIALVVAVVGFRVWAGVETGLAAAYFKKLGKRTTIALCTISLIGAALAIYVSGR
jgi:hypothetical protein